MLPSSIQPNPTTRRRTSFQSNSCICYNYAAQILRIERWKKEYHLSFLPLVPRLGPWVVYRSEARTLCLEGPLVLTLIGVLQVTQPLPGTTYICFDLLGHNLDMLASRLSSMDLLATLLLRLFSAGRPENEVPLAPLPMSADMVRICAFCLAWPSGRRHFIFPAECPGRTLE